jgi:hypothetical protein
LLLKSGGNVLEREGQIRRRSDLDFRGAGRGREPHAKKSCESEQRPQNDFRAFAIKDQVHEAPPVCRLRKHLKLLP